MTTTTRRERILRDMRDALRNWFNGNRKDAIRALAGNDPAAAVARGVAIGAALATIGEPRYSDAAAMWTMFFGSECPMPTTDELLAEDDS